MDPDLKNMMEKSNCLWGAKEALRPDSMSLGFSG